MKRPGRERENMGNGEKALSPKWHKKTSQN